MALIVAGLCATALAAVRTPTSLAQTGPRAHVVSSVVDETTFDAAFSTLDAALPFVTGAAAATAFGLVSAAAMAEPQLDDPYPMGRYDPNSAAAYFAERPGAVLFRALDIMRITLRLGVAVLIDWRLGRLEEREEKRAQQLLGVLTELGPTFVKVGQSLSTRPDLLTPAYVEALSQLQDQVPPFSTVRAFDIISSELGLPRTANPGEVPSVFSELSEPIAAASLGQVHRGKLRLTGEDVAVKVLRPTVREVIATDMFLLRSTAVAVKRYITWINTDLVALADELATTFIRELDYLAEASNAERFLEGIKTTALADAVTAPLPLRHLTTGRVLTTEWVEGQRLDAIDSPAERTRMCSVALAAYLMMLLEPQLPLHTDAQPGNLMRTEDGRLCVLDWGMVTEVADDVGGDLLLHMAHLSGGRFDEVPQDLVRLGFTAKGKEKAIEEAGVSQVLTNLYAQLAGGGGARKIDVARVIGKLTNLSEVYGNIFQLPSYMLYILRAFSLVEGLGLEVDEDYSIVDGCLPYLSWKMLTDSSPRSREALRSFISAAGQSDDAAQVDLAQVEKVFSGLARFASDSASPSADAGDEEDALSVAAGLVLDSRGNPLQALALEETSRVADALTRRTVDAALTTLRSSALLPVLDPLGISGSLHEILRPDTEDEQALQTVETLAQLRIGHGGESIAPRVLQEVWRRREGLPPLAARFGATLLLRASSRLDQVTHRNDDAGVVAIASLGKAVAALSAAQLASAASAGASAGAHGLPLGDRRRTDD